MVASVIEKLRNLASDPAATSHEAEIARSKIALLERTEPASSMQHGGHATLPDAYETRNHLRQMPVGGTGWMVPWGMVVDEQGRLYLHAEYTFEPRPGGTFCLYVEHQTDGYHVWLDGARRYGHTWDKSSSSWDKDIPVSRVHEGHIPLPDHRRY